MTMHARVYSCAVVIGLVAAACVNPYKPIPVLPGEGPRDAPPEQVSAPSSGPGRIVVTGPASIGVGRSVAFSASAVYSRRTQSITRRAAWESSANAVATVSRDGVVTGVSEGVATITATLSGVAGSVTVQVTPVVRGRSRPPRSGSPH
jgi:hypothetical protein